MTSANKKIAIDALETLQERINQNPHHFTIEKLMADRARTGASAIGQIGMYAAMLGYPISGLYPNLAYDNRPGARELLEVINYLILEA